MIDTVKIGFPIEISANDLSYGWLTGILLLPDGNSRNKNWKSVSVSSAEAGNTSTESHVVIKVQYYRATDKYPHPNLQIETSLPYILFGNNVQIIATHDQIVQGSEILQNALKSIKGLPALDVNQGRLMRVDFCYNYQVGGYVSDYLCALYRLIYPKRQTVIYPGEGVTFKCDSGIVRFYDKQKECENNHRYFLANDASGLLRHESQLRGSSYIASCLQIEKPNLLSITPDKAQSILEIDLERLEMKDKPILGEKVAEKILIERYGRKGVHLIGYLIIRQTRTREEFMRMNGNSISLRTIQEWERDIANAGVCLAMTDQYDFLAPLKIEWETQKSARCSK